MNAETLMALPEGARLAVKIAMSAEMSKLRTLHTGEFRHQTLSEREDVPDHLARQPSSRWEFTILFLPFLPNTRMSGQRRKA